MQATSFLIRPPDPEGGEKDEMEADSNQLRCWLRFRRPT